MSLVLCTTTTANGPTGNDNNNNTDNISDDSNPVTIYRFEINIYLAIIIKIFIFTPLKCYLLLITYLPTVDLTQLLSIAVVELSPNITTLTLSSG